MSRSTAYMASGVNAVVPSGINSPGWVSGDIKNLAASGAFSVMFDLGPRWGSIEVVQVVVNLAGPSTGLTGLSAFSRDDAVNGTPADARRCTLAYGAGLGTAYFNPVTSAGPQSFIIRPLGRYLVLTGANADAANVLGATSYLAACAYYDVP